MQMKTAILKRSSLIILSVIPNLVIVCIGNIYASSVRGNFAADYTATEPQTGQGQPGIYASSQEGVVREYARMADAKQRQFQEKTEAINRHYSKGKTYYDTKQYGNARLCFEQILEIDPSHEPAKLFLKSVILHEQVFAARKRIEGIKIQLADVMSEYDKRVQRVDRLAVKYFLEMAQKECQIGNFKAAEGYYNLCYKIHPYSKDDIEWFVKATHELMLLYDKLEQENTGMEELLNSIE
ncbi:MAG: tetratricopeptide repeat protein [Candidatus Omnitrophica bacterium]|nr:tetratricopeptide repeat protein [Candidatus Omnitrophota bacterium]